MGMLTRMISGGLAGGVAGSIFGGNRDYTVGGMFAGALGGALGMGRINAMASRIGGGLNISGNLSKAAVGGIRGITAARRGLRDYYARSVFSSPRGAGILGKAANRGVAMTRPVARGLGGVTRAIKRNTPAINKYGGYAAAIMGTMAAAKIGNTVLQSNNNNRGFGMRVMPR